MSSSQHVISCPSGTSWFFETCYNRICTNWYSGRVPTNPPPQPAEAQSGNLSYKKSLFRCFSLFPSHKCAHSPNAIIFWRKKQEPCPCTLPLIIGVVIAAHFVNDYQWQIWKVDPGAAINDRMPWKINSLQLKQQRKAFVSIRRGHGLRSIRSSILGWQFSIFIFCCCFLQI